MADVGRLAGVSAITVSRVLRQPERVAEETRNRIHAAIAELGYLPNSLAGSLKSQRTGVIACVVPSVEHSFIADALTGASEELRPAGFHVIIGQSGFLPEEEEALVRTFLAGRPDAMILTGLTHTPETRRLLAAAQVPVVEIGNIGPDVIDMVVGFSNAEAARSCTESLIGKGYRRFGYLLHAGSAQNDRSRDRFSGYKQAIAASGGKAEEGPTIEVEFSIPGGAAGLLALLEADETVDAICCSNDTIALGALYECERRGIAVPKRLAIAGFDDQEISAQCVPSLSSVRIPRRRMGQEAGRLIRRTLAGEPVPARLIDVGFELKLRSTT